MQALVGSKRIQRGLGKNTVKTTNAEGIESDKVYLIEWVDVEYGEEVHEKV